MRYIVTYILLILISLSISVLAVEAVSSQASDESTGSVRAVPIDIERFLYGNPGGYYGIPEGSDGSEGDVEQMVSGDPLDGISVYEQQQASSLSYEDGYTGSGWVDAMSIEGFIEGMSLPGLDEIVISDYKGLLGQVGGLSPERASRAKITKAFYIMAEKGGDPEDCSRALNFADRRVSRNICSSSDALGRSSLISKNLLKRQSQFLNRIRLKADLSMVPT